MREATLKKIIDYPCISIETDFLKGVMSIACLKIVLKTQSLSHKFLPITSLTRKSAASMSESKIAQERR